MAESNTNLNCDCVITKNPDFVIDMPSDGDYTIASVATYRSIIYSASKELLKAATTSKCFIKVVGAIGDLPFMVINIALQYEEEGLLKATITGVGADTTALLGGIAIGGISGSKFGGVPGAIIGAISTGLFSLILNPVADATYDYFDKINNVQYNEVNGALTIGTQLSDINDLKILTEPLILFGTVEENVYLNEITINQNINGEITTYTVQKDNTIWGVCEKYGMSYDELIESNPWLAERFSEDRTFALIRPNEKLIIPNEFLNKETDLLNDENLIFNELYNQGMATEPIRRDPLLIDLNGDGIKTTDMFMKLFSN